MLTVTKAEFYYDSTHTTGFNKVSLTLKHGEALCILGPNGCGKTTLIKCLGGLYRLHKGSILLDNKELTKLGRSAVARIVGYVPQLHQPAFPFSVLDAVLVGRAPHLDFLASPGKQDVEIAEAAIEALGISHLKNKPYTEISGGERQLVVFARVIAQQPKLLLLDEPTSHLDFGNQIRILELIKETTAEGLPVVMTTHFPDYAFIISNKVALMKEGAILALGTPDEVITEENLYNVYGVKVKVMHLGGAVNRKICIPIGQ